VPPVLRHVPERPTRFAEGLCAGQADVAKRCVVERGEVPALAPDPDCVGDLLENPSENRAVRSGAVGGGECGHDLYPFHLVNDEPRSIIFIDVYGGMCFILQMNVY